MGEKTGIQWTDHTFNPWWGCAKVSPACQHCYAETFSKRVGERVWGLDAPRRFFGGKHWEEPRRWNAAAVKAGVRRRVFCASMADVFEDRHDLVGARADLWSLIGETPQLDWLLLTKRPENISKMLRPSLVGAPNVWLGTTVENQEYADIRISKLIHHGIAATVLFLSVEPMLGPIDLGLPFGSENPLMVDRHVDWVICGGESGSHARPIHPDWARSLRDQCVTSGTWFFFKQWGGLHPKSNGAELDGREWKEVPHRGVC